MQTTATPHSFHIPVMGLGYTVDTPLKVAQFGISSVISIMDDQLLEDMRRIHSSYHHIPYEPIAEDSEDSRAARIRAYLDLVQTIIDLQITTMIDAPIRANSPIARYIELLPESSLLKADLYRLLNTRSPLEKEELSRKIKAQITPGSADVNIMTKVDKLNRDKNGDALPREFSDALAALRGFATSKINGCVVFSAGMNPSLYSYAEQFPEFYPDEHGHIRKGIILKVSDYRSALIQGKFLAKKGLWVSEFRIESGLNCGGHAFATEGHLIGPILGEFKAKREELTESLAQLVQLALDEKKKHPLSPNPKIRITYQGGIGTAEEDSFLRKHYLLDGTGWGSPFLLVPEATAVDNDTLDRIIQAKQSDFYLSQASPLGVPFNNLKNSSGEEQRLARIEKNRPGSPCFKKFLSFSTEFTTVPICTASRQYQNLKTKQLHDGDISAEELEEVLAKDCLCEGLGAPAILSHGEVPRRNLTAVTLCPGPNLVYFKGIFSLKEMVDHIYGRVSIRLVPDRPHVFIKELQLYVSYLKNEIEKLTVPVSVKQESYLEKFRSNLLKGVEYYRGLVEDAGVGSKGTVDKIKAQLQLLGVELEKLQLTY